MPLCDILTPYSASWVGWLMLSVFLMLVWITIVNPRWITDSLAIMFARVERRYTRTASSRVAEIVSGLFAVCTLAFALYLALYNDRSFKMGTYWAIVGIIVAIGIAKIAIMFGLNGIFRFYKPFKLVVGHYLNIWKMTCFFLYIVSLAALQGLSVKVTIVLYGVVMALFLLAVTVSAFRTLCFKPISVLYITIYLLTLEVLPLAALYRLTEEVIAYYE